jgi:hypothetical protein
MTTLAAHPCATPKRLQRWAAVLLLAPVLQGCAVLAVADVAASVVVGTAGLAVDAAVGTAKMAGSVVGKTADVVFGTDPAP